MEVHAVAAHTLLKGEGLTNTAAVSVASEATLNGAPQQGVASGQDTGQDIGQLLSGLLNMISTASAAEPTALRNETAWPPGPDPGAARELPPDSVMRPEALPEAASLNALPPGLNAVALPAALPLATAADAHAAQPLITQPTLRPDAVPLAVPVMVNSLRTPAAQRRRIQRDARDDQENSSLPHDQDDQTDDAPAQDAETDALITDHNASQTNEGFTANDRALQRFRLLHRLLSQGGQTQALAELRERRRVLVVIALPPSRAPHECALYLMTIDAQGIGRAQHYRARGELAMTQHNNGKATPAGTGAWQSWRLHRDQGHDGRPRLSPGRRAISAVASATQPIMPTIAVRLQAQVLPPPLGHGPRAWLDVLEPQRLWRDLQGQWSVTLLWQPAPGAGCPAATAPAVE